LVVLSRLRYWSGRVKTATASSKPSSRMFTAGCLRPETGDDSLQHLLCGFRVRRFPDHPELGVEFALQVFRAGVQDVAGEVGLAPLPHGSLELVSTAFTSPPWWSETTRSTPLSPLPLSHEKKSHQLA
jgi:hypothetical protein